MDNNIKKHLKGCSITTGTVRYHDLGYIHLVDNKLIKENYQHTFDMVLDMNEWNSELLNWTVISSTVIYHPEEKCIRLGNDGSIKTSGGGFIEEEKRIVTKNADPKKRGLLREISEINGKAYAVGVCRQAYVRTNKNKWKCIDKSAQTYKSFENDYECSFESITGFSDKEIYTAGWNGEIWFYNGIKFERLKQKTKNNLYKIRTSSDGLVYACGANGIIIRGRKNNWEKIETQYGDLWGCVEYNNEMYFSTINMVYKLVGSNLIEVDFGDVLPSSCYHLTASDGIMWSIGAMDVVEYNGVDWKIILKLGK